MLTTLIVALALAADPAPKNDTMKNLMKDVATDKPSDGPDVSKMPFTQDSIKQVVMAYQPKIQGCYEDHIANKKKAPEGMIKTAWVITAEDNVVYVTTQAQADNIVVVVGHSTSDGGINMI